ncbi:MAG: hypothetical protein WC915_04245 [archaeon]|jgi:hypothetical protein
MQNKKNINNTYLNNFFIKLNTTNQISFYLKTDPKFYFEYKKFSLNKNLNTISINEQNIQLNKMLSEAEARRLLFMINSLKNEPIKNSLKELQIEYGELSKKYELQINKIKNEVHDKEINEFNDNLDYKNMIKTFDKMAKLKKGE